MAGIAVDSTAAAAAVTSLPNTAIISTFVPNSTNPTLYDVKLAKAAAFVGPTGPAGAAGATGPTGATGPAGATGPSGAPSIVGLTAITKTLGAQRGIVFDTDNTPKAASLPNQRVGINQGAIALTFASSVATDCSLGNVFTLTMAGNATLAAPTNLVAGATYLWFIKQDGTGGRTITWGGSGVFKWPGGTAPALSTLANAVDILSAYTDGTTVYGVLTKGFA